MIRISSKNPDQSIPKKNVTSRTQIACRTCKIANDYAYFQIHALYANSHSTMIRLVIPREVSSLRTDTEQHQSLQNILHLGFYTQSLWFRFLFNVINFVPTATLDGGIGMLLPMQEKTYRRLLMLQNALNTMLPHHAGLNPKAFRCSCCYIFEKENSLALIDVNFNLPSSKWQTLSGNQVLDVNGLMVPGCCTLTEEVCRTL